MSQDIERANNLGAELVEKVVVDGDLAKLTSEERLRYYREVCASVGLNPLTKPFEYIKLNGKLRLYALKGATDQLRSIHGISITHLQTDYPDDLIVVTASASDKHGRTDSDTGAVPIGSLKGEAKANAIMKAITKAKRRVTLSMVGLGMLDETEVDAIPNAEAVSVETAHDSDHLDLDKNAPPADDPLMETDKEFPPDPPPQVTAGITGRQTKTLIKALEQAELGGDDARKFVSWLVGRDVSRVLDLTGDEAQSILDKWADARTKTGIGQDKVSDSVQKWVDHQAMQAEDAELEPTPDELDAEATA